MSPQGSFYYGLLKTAKVWKVSERHQSEASQRANDIAEGQKKHSNAKTGDAVSAPDLSAQKVTEWPMAPVVLVLFAGGRQEAQGPPMRGWREAGTGTGQSSLNYSYSYWS